MKVKFILIFISTILFSFVLSEQKKEKMILVRGEVRDSSQKPVKGAYIFIDGKKTSSKSDEKGYYNVRVNPDAREISVVSPQGGVDKTDITGRTKIDFTLSESEGSQPDSLKDIREIELVNSRTEVKKKRNEITDETSVKKNRYSSYTNIYDMIRSELPAVLVRGTSVYIHGNSTFGGSPEAIFDVDGIVMEQINDISPNDVNTIRVLKGPETASYGMRGANGVIVITTFRGTDKK